jgi:hypothetical protein
MTYLQKILSSQPYTDEKGYELVTPFPWGRWKVLIEALYETHLGVLVPGSTLQDVEQISGTNVFLFAGVGSISGSSSQKILKSQLAALSNVSSEASDATTFELVNPLPGSQQTNILNSMQPDSSLLLTQAQSNTQAATKMFLTGNLPPQAGSALALATHMTDKTSNTTTSTGVNLNSTVTTQNNPDVVGTSASRSTTQSQAFISKLINSNSGTTTKGQ